VAVAAGEVWAGGRLCGWAGGQGVVQVCVARQAGRGRCVGWCGNVGGGGWAVCVQAVRWQVL